MGCHGRKGIKASAWLLNCDWVGRAKSRGLSWPRFRVGSGRSNPSANVGFGCDAACFHPPKPCSPTIEPHRTSIERKATDSTATRELIPQTGA